ncbi:D-lactate dehydrogenase [Klebsiella pneumoniae]|uniref:D-lactate dehydrogenase n=1 Tax=Klebsiella pneumoniae TaxID=573 RepID=A0A377W2R1_KLEPN|nr:D-lactate dehydrogenase [Klebsiella pneumoniae]
MSFPGTLLELWRVLNACVDADKIILMQAANTGLTEGSTPNGNDYDREIVIISTLRLDKLHLLDKGEQVLAWPGTTLYSLEKALKPLGREPHSGDRFVMHRRIGHRRDLQQLRRLAGAARGRPTLRCRCSRRLTPTAS